MPIYCKKPLKSSSLEPVDRFPWALHLGLSEPKFYGDFVYKLKKKIMSRTDVSDQFRNNILRYERIRYNLNVMCDSLHA